MLSISLKKTFFLLSLLSFSAYSQNPTVTEVLEHKGQKILIKPSGHFDSAIIKINEIDCHTGNERFGKYNFLTVEKKWSNQKEDCLVTSTPVVEQILLFNDKENKSVNNLLYIGFGVTSSGFDYGQENVKTAMFNYSIGYFKKERKYLLGGIYHVSALRNYGNMDIMINQEYTQVEEQFNTNLLGIAYRPYFLTTEETSPYLRLDLGLAWVTSGKSIILSPFENSGLLALGANIGIGLALKTSFGSINVEVYQTLYKSPEVKEMGTGVTNFTFGAMF